LPKRLDTKSIDELSKLKFGSSNVSSMLDANIEMI
jgi:hypothetical protein